MSWSEQHERLDGFAIGSILYVTLQAGDGGGTPYHRKIYRFNGTSLERFSNTSNGATSDDNPEAFTKIGSRYYFVAQNPNGADKIYFTDGTSITQAADLNGAANTDVHDRRLIPFNDEIYFVTDIGGANYRLAKISSAGAVTRFNTAIPVTTNILTPCGNWLYFVQNDSDNLERLFALSSTGELRQVSRLNTGATQDDFGAFMGQSLLGGYDTVRWTCYGEAIYFPTSDSNGYGHLYRADQNGIAQITAMGNGARDSIQLPAGSPTSFWSVVSNNRLYFFGDTGGSTDQRLYSVCDSSTGCSDP
jgi:hypothetical protein